MKEENKKEKIAAVVVTYNRKELLKECLDALLNQTYSLDSIILIDNASADSTPEFLEEQGYLKNPKIDYVRLPENIGGAGGFHEGVKRGYEKSYDWLWLMDDDAEPKKDALEKLSKYFKIEKNVSALACLKIGENGQILQPHRGYFDFENIPKRIVSPFDERRIKEKFIEIDHASFVGILVNKKAIQKIGYPKKEFFIHYDDVEYCIRLRQVGKILLVPDSVIVHKEATQGARLTKSFMGIKSIRTPYNKFWLNYYNRRNLVWLGTKYSTNKIKFYLNLCGNFLKLVIGVLIYDDCKSRRIYSIANAYIDGLKGNFDNGKPKRILYNKIEMRK